MPFKTIFFFLCLISLCLIYNQLENNKSTSRAFEAYNHESKNSREIYTGKIKPVYNPLDEAFKVTSFLEDQRGGKSSFKILKNIPLIDLWVNPVDLYGSSGIIDQGKETGRLWERAGLIKHYHMGELKQESLVGIRLHGGSSRLKSKPLKSFRVYFRKKYGDKKLIFNDGITLKNNKHKVKRFVIRRSTPISFQNDLTAFLINELGGLAPEFQQVMVYLNGEFYGHMDITEHLSSEQFSSFLGHENFIFAKFKSDKTLRDKLRYDSLRSRMESMKPFNLKIVKEYLDLDSIMASLLTIMFTGNTDWAQGVYVKDLSKKSKWTLISWDFDRAFYKEDSDGKREGMKFSYEKKSVQLGTEMKKGTIRWSVFNRLIFTDKKFRSYFSAKVDELIKLLSSKSLSDKINEYKRYANDAQYNKNLKSSFDRIKFFLKGRPLVLCRDLKEFVQLSTPECEKILGEKTAK